MSKTLKTLLYILCVSALLVGFGACKSQPEPKPEPKPEPVIPAEPEKNEEQEKAARLLDELTKVRAEAIKVKANTAYPVQFKSADDTAAAARSGYESNNFADAQAKAQRAITQYRTLINRTKIDELKAKIDQNDLSAYDAANYKKAEDAAARIPGLYESDPSKAFEASQQALNYYETVKEAGFASLMKDAKQKADEARERCDSVKASTAMKDPYTKTVNRYRAAGIAAGNKRYEQAYTGYMTAADEFNDIYEKVQIKRAQANDAMERARARQEASSKLAKDADREAPLPEDAEGFSEEPVDLEELQRSTTAGNAASSGNGR
ncbi:hypothetical protein E4N71_02435 [Treponema vincentii]|uniref:hypothetical protein n=1 Tax=Treponema vincentii TaxID=69710 RepID=UPI0020A54E56|nr:hypothetical protein [Treponema vincentii]UTC59394.1 hypothetical protein E4N70_08035 [Treponema vincentii]